MIAVEIPGSVSFHALYLVLDYNGTLAVDGMLIPGVKELLDSLAAHIEIHVVTADTFGKVREELRDIKCEVVVISGENQSEKKYEYISQLGVDGVIAIGNGRNDSQMLKNAVIGIAVIQKEGASKESILEADIVCHDIIDALNLVMNPLRLTATLRN
jgi:P-type E1-E2 ATPase